MLKDVQVIHNRLFKKGILNKMLWVMLIMSLAAIITPHREKPSETKAETLFEYGKASWYGADFEGKRTASGDIFRSDFMTAAHPTLPMGSYVKVTCFESGKSVIVKINDRGPFVQGRVIDLSKAAFDAINHSNKGVITVKIEIVEPSSNN